MMLKCLKFTGLLMLSAASAGCEGMFSLTAYEQLDSFSAQVPLNVADRRLNEVAQRHQQTLNRDAQPQDRQQPRGYLATILMGRCMLLAEGNGSPARMTFTVRFEATRNDPCINRMRPVFADAKAELESLSN